MKTKYGLIGIGVVLAWLAYQYFTVPGTSPTEPVVKGDGLDISPPTVKREPNQAQPVPTQGNSLPSGLPDMTVMPQDVGPFPDADPNKPPAQSTEPDRNVGEFVDAGGPPPAIHSTRMKETQADKRISITPPKPLQYP
jgi:hypothetical protein